MLDYVQKLREIADRVKNRKEFAESVSGRGGLSGKQLADIQEGFEHDRHDCVVLVVASRYEVDTQERSFRHHIESLISQSAYSSISHDHDFDKTPDIYYKNSYVDNLSGETHIDISIFDIAVTVTPRMTRERKYAKYNPVVEKFKSKVHDSNREARVSVIFRPVVMRRDLSNWDEILSLLPRGARDLEFEADCFSICKHSDECLSILENHIHLLGPKEARDFSVNRSHGRMVESEFLGNITIDFDDMNAVIDRLPGSMDRYEGPEFANFEGSMVDFYLNSYVPAWKKLETGFNDPNPERLLEAERKVAAKLKNNYEQVPLSNAGPTFHFLHVPEDENQLKGFEAKFDRVSSLLKYADVNDDHAKFVKEVFCAKLEEVDRRVFMAEGTIDEWDKVKQQLDCVKEPKVLKNKVFSNSSRNLLKSFGIGDKKERKRLREADKEEGEKSSRAIMKTINWWEGDNVEEINKVCGKKADYFVSRSSTHVDSFKSDDKRLEKMSHDWDHTLLNEFETHLHRLSQYILYKGNSIGKGVHVINTGNKDLFVLTLPGGDVTENRGDVRFLQVAIVETAKLESKVDSIFNREIVVSEVKVANYTILISRWMSLNRERWLHIEKTMVKPFLITMTLRAEYDIRNMKHMAFAYMYSAYGCQSKISGILDNFRYMIVGSLADKSGLESYILDKVEIPVKTLGQGWLMARLFGAIWDLSDSRKTMKMEPQVYVDDELSDESGGLSVSLQSVFVPGLMWKTKDHSMGELYTAFHLTGKAFHEKTMRDIDFVRSVMGGEVEYKDMILKHGADKVRNGLEFEEVEKIFEEKRGGLYVTKAVQWSGYLSTMPCNVGIDKLNKDLNKENFSDSVLTIPGLSSTKSSLEHAGLRKDGQYEIKTRTMLETSLELVEEHCNMLVDDIKEELDQHQLLLDEMFEQSKIPRLYSPVTSEGNGGSSGNLADSENSAELEYMLRKSEQEFREKRLAEMFDKLNKVELERRRRRAFRDPNFAETVRRAELLDNDLINSIGGTVTLFTKDGERTVSSEEYDKILDNYNINVKAKGMRTIHQAAKDFNDHVVDNATPFLNGMVRKDSVLHLAMHEVKTIPIYKIVPKGQRTQKDREIFVQNSSRYVTFLEEHICCAICKQIPQECITVPGDEKMLKLKRLYEKGQVWKRKELVVNNCRMIKHVKYITGDMSKFSNHDTAWRLRAWVEGGKVNLPDKVFNLLKTLIRLDTCKKVVAPTSLLQNDVIDENDSLHEIFKRCDSVFPECKMEQNWLQGMRNYMASAAHAGACMSMAKLFMYINPEELYFDFLVHSDDWVICYGYCTPELMTFAQYNYSWRLKYGIKLDRDIDDFLLTLIWYVYKLNNLTVSVKKSSISDKFVEFVSYTVSGGSCYMGYEKQLLSIFAEKPCLGPMEDIVATISQASSAILKGCDSATVDMFLHYAISRLRADYSMGKGQRFDPCEFFKVSPEDLPLCFLPDLKCSSLDMTLTNVYIHDHNLINRLYQQIVVKKEGSDEEKRAASLLVNLSILQFGKSPGFDGSLEADPTSKLVPGIKFRPKNVDKIKDSLTANTVFPQSMIKHLMSLDFTHGILRPKDFLFSLMDSHQKLLDPAILLTLTRHNKINLLRMRGDYKNKKSAKLNAESDYSSLKTVYQNLENYMDLTQGEELDELLSALSLMSDNLNTIDKQMARWLNDMHMTPSSTRKPVQKSVMKLPSLAKSVSFINKPNVLIVEQLHPERFMLNNEEIHAPAAHNMDVENLSMILGKSGYFKCRSLSEKKRNLELVMKFIPRENDTTHIMTCRRRNCPAVESAVRWIKSCNSFYMYKAITSSRQSLGKYITILNPTRRDRAQCMYDISELALFTRVAIETENQNPLITQELKVVKEGKPMFEVVADLKMDCIETKMNLPDRYSSLFAFLQSYYTGNNEQCANNYRKSFTFRYDKKDVNWTKNDPYKDAVIVMSKMGSDTSFLFQSGVLKIVTNYEPHASILKDTLYQFYLRHRNSYSFDNYRYFIKDTDEIDHQGLYLAGHSGSYHLFSPVAGHFPKTSIIAKVEQSNETPLFQPNLKITFDKPHLSYNIHGSVVGSLNHPLLCQTATNYRIRGYKGMVDLDKVIRDGLFSDFAGGTMTKFNISFTEFCLGHYIAHDYKHYLLAMLHELGEWGGCVQGLFQIEKNQAKREKAIKINLEQYYPSTSAVVEQSAVHTDREEFNVLDLSSESEQTESSDESRESGGSLVIDWSDTSDKEIVIEAPRTRTPSDEEEEKALEATQGKELSWEEEMELEYTTRRQMEKLAEDIKLVYTSPEERQHRVNTLDKLEHWLIACCNRGQLEAIEYVHIMLLFYTVFFDLTSENDARLDFSRFEENDIMAKRVNSLLCFCKYATGHPMFGKGPLNCNKNLRGELGKLRAGLFRFGGILSDMNRLMTYIFYNEMEEQAAGYVFDRRQHW